MKYIYLLKLQNNKYFVGNTNCLKTSYDKYFIKKKYDIEWLKVNKPIKMEKMYHIGNINKYTLKYMSKYSIQDVRGGKYSDLIIEKKELEQLKKKLNPITLKNNYNINYIDSGNYKSYSDIYYINKNI